MCWGPAIDYGGLFGPVWASLTNHPLTVAIRRQQSAVRPSTAVLVHRPRRSAFIGSASIEGGLPRRPVCNKSRRGSETTKKRETGWISVTHRRLSMSDETDN